MAEVIRAKSAGFCMGVGRALHLLDKAVAEGAEASIVTLGPIIHNPQVIEEYNKQGITIANMEDIPYSNAQTILIRAHGIPQEKEKELYATGKNIVDATCPKVKDAQIAIQKATMEGYTILIYGEKEHAEVLGLCSYANKFYVFATVEELKEYIFTDTERYALASQTTQSTTEFKGIYEWLLRTVDDTILYIDTICDATYIRQKEVAELVELVDAMVIVGGYSSGNTKRLCEVAQHHGVYTVHVETAVELPLDELQKCAVIGLSAGASTPKTKIDEVEQILLGL